MLNDAHRKCIWETSYIFQKMRGKCGENERKKQTRKRKKNSIWTFHLIKVNASLFYMISFTATSSKVTHRCLKPLRCCLPCVVEQSTRTESNQNQRQNHTDTHNQKWSWLFFFRCCCFYFRYSWHCLLVLMYGAPSHRLIARHHVCAIVQQTETAFGMLTSFFGMNKILVNYLEVATYCFKMVSDEVHFIVPFCLILYLFSSSRFFLCVYVDFRFRLRFRRHFRWIEIK